MPFFLPHAFYWESEFSDFGSMQLVPRCGPSIVPPRQGACVSCLYNTLLRREVNYFLQDFPWKILAFIARLAENLFRGAVFATVHNLNRYRCSRLRAESEASRNIRFSGLIAEIRMRGTKFLSRHRPMARLAVLSRLECFHTLIYHALGGLSRKFTRIVLGTLAGWQVVCRYFCVPLRTREARFRVSLSVPRHT